MDERLRRALHERVEEYLTAVERFITATGAPDGWAQLRDLLRPLVTGWRLLLSVHEPDHCPLCARAARRHGGCTVWRTATAVLVGRFPEV